MIPLGQELLPGAALLSVRGKVLENGMPRFFRRFAEGVFDVEDLKFRADELSGFVDAARKQYGLDNKTLVAVGYSNGANIAAGLILLHPHLLPAAVLFRAMVPFKVDPAPNLAGTSILLNAGRRDFIASPENVNELAGIFRAGGADVSIHWHNGGHELGQDDLDAAKSWLAKPAR
jgi:phospholipase/carboxylesterase/glyoxalase family protein